MILKAGLITSAIVVVLFIITLIWINLSVKKERKMQERAQEVIREPQKRRGNGKCWRCGGSGCSSCENSGDCISCKGRGISDGNPCMDCQNNYWFIKTGRDG